MSEESEDLAVQLRALTAQVRRLTEEQGKNTANMRTLQGDYKKWRRKEAASPKTEPAESDDPDGDADPAPDDAPADQPARKPKTPTQWELMDALSLLTPDANARMRRQIDAGDLTPAEAIRAIELGQHVKAPPKVSRWPEIKSREEWAKFKETLTSDQYDEYLADESTPDVTMLPEKRMFEPPPSTPTSSYKNEQEPKRPAPTGRAESPPPERGHAGRFANWKAWQDAKLQNEKEALKWWDRNPTFDPSKLPGAPKG